jgi:hypothetical protein
MDLTAQDVIDIINDDSTKYKLLDKILVHRYVGDMTIECTYDYIFEHLGDSYSVEVLLTNEDDDDMWEEYFIDSYDDKIFTAIKGNYYNFPSFVKDGDTNPKLAQICLDFYVWATQTPDINYSDITGTYKTNIDEWLKNRK